MYPPQDLSLVASTGRPQLLNSYADWCTTCQHNHPIVDALAEQFAGKVDLVSLNIDVPETQTVRDRFNITDRSQYVFIDAAGNTIQRWYGFIDQTQVAQAIQDYLTKNSL
jgi:thiol:disulfide interchange protein